MNRLLENIRKVPDFPKPGILFYDITTVLQDRELFAEAMAEMIEPFKNDKIDKLCGIESRGFIFAAAMAEEMKAGFVPIRKPGKLPYKTRREDYTLEYGTDALEIHEDAIEQGERVLVVDDLLATGGTAEAAVKLLKQCGADIVGCEFMIELKDLSGREKIKDQRIHSLFKV